MAENENNITDDAEGVAPANDPAAGEASAPAEGGAAAAGAPPAPAADGEGAASDSVDSGAAPKGPEAAKPAAPAAEEPKDEDWRDRRIAQLTAKLHAERNKNGASAPAASSDVAAAEDVNAVAARMVAEQNFNNACNSAAAEGRKAYADFDTRLGGLKQIVDPNDPAEVAAYNRMLAAIIETGEAPRLLYELGGDPNKASKMLGLSAQAPMKLAVELTKMALTKGEPAPSAAPKPITPVGDRGRSSTPIDPTDKDKADGLSTSDWMARREADVAKKRAGGMRIA
jgi:hypothetical protein